MRRYPPESREPAESLPLFDGLASAEAARNARARADAGMAQAAERAERVEPGWRDGALEAVRRYALRHSHFMAEDVPLGIPSSADPRAAGAVFTDAMRRGWIAKAGYAPANTSNRSPKVLWASRILSGRPAGAEERSDELPGVIERVNTQR